jgi:recombination protein RecT
MAATKTTRQARQQPAERGITVRDEEQRKMTELATAVAKRQDQLASLLGSTVDPERFITVALQAVQSQPGLMKCTTLSLLTAIREAATYGLEPAGMLGDAAIVPRGGVAMLEIEYRGLRKLALRDGTVRAIDAAIVHSTDEFRIEKGSDPRVVHVPDLNRPAESTVIGGYAWARLTSGELLADFMPISEILKRRAVSQSFRKAESQGSNDSVWHVWPETMMVKTVLKRFISEKLPLSPLAREAIAKDTLADVAGPAVRVTQSTATEARDRLLARFGLGGDPKALGDGAGDGQAATEAKEEDADASKPVSEAQGPNLGVEPSQPAENGGDDVPVALCGAQSPYEGGEKCRKPAGHEKVDEPGAKMHRSSARETWE